MASVVKAGLKQSIDTAEFAVQKAFDAVQELEDALHELGAAGLSLGDNTLDAALAVAKQGTGAAFAVLRQIEAVVPDLPGQDVV